MVFSATLPVKPSVTMTSTVPGRCRCPRRSRESRSAARFAQHRRGFAQRLVALQILGADVEQAHASARARPSTVRAKTLAHDRELHQVVRHRTRHWRRDRASRSRRAGREVRGDRRPVDARQRLQHELRHRHQRAGIAGGDDPVRLAAGTASIAQRMLELRPERSATEGRALPAMTSLASRTSTRDRSCLWQRTSGATSPSRPNSRKRTSRPGLSHRCRPSTTTAGARSPPIASTAIVMVSGNVFVLFLVLGLPRRTHRPSAGKDGCTGRERRTLCAWRYPASYRFRSRRWGVPSLACPTFGVLDGKPQRLGTILPAAAHLVQIRQTPQAACGNRRSSCRHRVRDPAGHVGRSWRRRRQKAETPAG